MNAIVSQGHFSDTTPSGRHTLFSPRSQAEFLRNLSTFGNVRLACRAAAVSPQTAYRARRASRGFALAWDAALLAARAHAEEVLADRAISGVEEAVFYHGEEVARRRRYDSRLLLAHLARLDRLEEKPEVAAELAQLDRRIEALREGREPDVEGAQAAPAFSGQDRVPSVPDRRNAPCQSCGGQCTMPGAKLGPDDCMWLDNRLARMDAARPKGERTPAQLTFGTARDAGTIEKLQLKAFEAGVEQWWLVTEEGEAPAFANPSPLSPR